MRRSKNPCRQRFTGTQGKCARLVLKACADKRNCVYLTAYADKQKGKVCMHRSGAPNENIVQNHLKCL